MTSCNIHPCPAAPLSSLKVRSASLRSLFVPVRQTFRIEKPLHLTVLPGGWIARRLLLRIEKPLHLTVLPGGWMARRLPLRIEKPFYTLHVILYASLPFSLFVRSYAPLRYLRLFSCLACGRLQAAPTPSFNHHTAPHHTAAPYITINQSPSTTLHCCFGTHPLFYVLMVVRRLPAPSPHRVLFLQYHQVRVQRPGLFYRLQYRYHVTRRNSK